METEKEIQYRLGIDGDYIERYYWGLFIKDYFPSYEPFWLKYIVPLTNRPYNINFKTDEELLKLGKSTKDLRIAQLSYSAITNLGRCFDIINIFKNERKNILEQRDFFIEGFTRLVGAQDNVFELLERKKNPVYDPFNQESGKLATQKWRRENALPLKTIRDYRNCLVHGGIYATFYDDIDINKVWFAKIGTEDRYLDWRIVTDISENNKTIRDKAKDDFILPSTILEGAFDETVKYFENHFKNL